MAEVVRVEHFSPNAMYSSPGEGCQDALRDWFAVAMVEVGPQPFTHAMDLACHVTVLRCRR